MQVKDPSGPHHLQVFQKVAGNFHCGWSSVRGPSSGQALNVPTLLFPLPLCTPLTECGLGNHLHVSMSGPLRGFHSGLLGPGCNQVQCSVSYPSYFSREPMPPAWLSQDLVQERVTEKFSPGQRLRLFCQVRLVLPLLDSFLHGGCSPSIFQVCTVYSPASHSSK